MSSFVVICIPDMGLNGQVACTAGGQFYCLLWGSSLCHVHKGSFFNPAIGCKHRLDAGFVACPFDKSWPGCCTHGLNVGRFLLKWAIFRQCVPASRVGSLEQKCCSLTEFPDKKLCNRLTKRKIVLGQWCQNIPKHRFWVYICKLKQIK